MSSLREEKKFVAWVTLVLAMLFGIGIGLPALVVLAIPEPLPSLSAETLGPIIQKWWLPGEVQQHEMLMSLAHYVAYLTDEALHEDDRLASRTARTYAWRIDSDGRVFHDDLLDYSINSNAECGRYQLDGVDVERDARIGSS